MHFGPENRLATAKIRQYYAATKQFSASEIHRRSSDGRFLEVSLNSERFQMILLGNNAWSLETFPFILYYSDEFVKNGLLNCGWFYDIISRKGISENLPFGDCLRF